MKRLLVFTENYARGGGNLYLTDFAAAAERHFEQVVVASNPGGLFPEDRARLPARAAFQVADVWTRTRLFRNVDERWLRLMLLPFYFLASPLLLFWNIRILSRLLSAAAPDMVVCCNGGYPGGRSVLLLAWIASRRRCPVLMTVVSTPLLRRSPFDRLVDSFCRVSVTCMIGNARAVVEGLCMQRGMTEERTCIIHNCVPDLVCARPQQRSEVTIGCVARMDFGKGVRELLDAFDALSTRFPSARLLLVGAGDASSWLEGEVERRRLADKVRICGHQKAETVAALWREMDIFVLPSWHEGLPYSVLEAMRAALPVVASEVGGIPEAVKAEDTGLLVPPRSTSALESALARLLTDLELRKQMGARGRARYLECFGPRSMERSVDDLFSKMNWISAESEVRRS